MVSIKYKQIDSKVNELNTNYSNKIESLQLIQSLLINYENLNKEAANEEFS